LGLAAAPGAGGRPTSRGEDRVGTERRRSPGPSRFLVEGPGCPHGRRNILRPKHGAGLAQAAAAQGLGAGPKPRGPTSARHESSVLDQRHRRAQTTSGSASLGQNQHNGPRMDPVPGGARPSQRPHQPAAPQPNPSPGHFPGPAHTKGRCGRRPPKTWVVVIGAGRGVVAAVGGRPSCVYPGGSPPRRRRPAPHFLVFFFVFASEATKRPAKSSAPKAQQLGQPFSSGQRSGPVAGTDFATNRSAGSIDDHARSRGDTGRPASNSLEWVTGF